MVSNLRLALLRDFERCVVRPWLAHGNAHSNFRFRHESSITALYPPFYRRLEFCNLLIRGALAEVLIAEPCINFAGCGEGLSAGEDCGVGQTAREVAVLKLAKSENVLREITICSRLEICNRLESLLLSLQLNRAFSIRRLWCRGRATPRLIPNSGMVLLPEFCHVRITQR